MSFIINRNLKIVTKETSKAIGYAVNAFLRDLKKVFIQGGPDNFSLVLELKRMDAEKFQLETKKDELYLRAGDDLGFIYGIFWISRELLGIQNFWFWNDERIKIKKEEVLVDDFHYESTPYAVKFRGWFINDEVLLHTWMVDRDKDKPWEMVFEALLRCGGNMVIPGTDKNGKKYKQMAANMGLYITHHHAEPLGAEMFSRAYPDLHASYDEYPELFQGLWKKAIEEQKDSKVIWNLGFRGQGDCPFWENDMRYDTPEKRGTLISNLIKIQYEMVKEQNPNAFCCTNLYGETMELYKEGYLDIPQDVILIWADNGYGKMVSRRQNNHNPRVRSMPEKGDSGMHGVYYHVSFFDLQAANHITMLQNAPDFVKKQLEELKEYKVDQFWIINCSNVKPHVYYLDFIASYWKDGEIDIQKHLKEYITTYYGIENLQEIAHCLRDYHKYAVSYGKEEDEHAGEQFSNYVTRMLVSQCMRNVGEPAVELLWFANTDTLMGQVKKYAEICSLGEKNYGKYLSECESLFYSMKSDAKSLFHDSILLQARIHFLCFSGALCACSGMLEMANQNWKKAFYHTGCARKLYQKANASLRACEKGKWHNFYQNECLTDIKQTAYILEGFMHYLRNMEDGPAFYKWQREFLYSEKDKKVMLVLNMENHLTDLEIFELMKEADFGSME